MIAMIRDKDRPVEVDRFPSFVLDTRDPSISEQFCNECNECEFALIVEEEAFEEERFQAFRGVSWILAVLVALIRIKSASEKV